MNRQYGVFKNKLHKSPAALSHSKKVQTGVTVAMVNRMLALIRSILNKAKNEWGQISGMRAVS